jgi:hypothetical protein
MFGYNFKVPMSQTIQFSHPPCTVGPGSFQIRFEKELQKKMGGL